MKTVMVKCFDRMAVWLIFIMTYETSQHNFATTLDSCFGQEDVALMRWPPRSPDVTPYDFFLWEFVKDTVFVPPVPANLQ